MEREQLEISSNLAERLFSEVMVGLERKGQVSEIEVNLTGVYSD